MILPPRKRVGRKLLAVTVGGASLGISACFAPHGTIAEDAGVAVCNGYCGIMARPDAGFDAGTFHGISPLDAGVDGGASDAGTPMGRMPVDGGPADSGTMMGLFPQDAGVDDAGTTHGIAPMTDGG